LSSYLLNRNGHYHIRIRIPSDLTSVIPAVELVKSLKTRDAKTAKVVALPYRESIIKTFTLLRSGFITGEQARDSIDKVLSRKGKATPSALSSFAPEPPCNPSSAVSLPLPCPLPQPKQMIMLSTMVEQFLNYRKCSGHIDFHHT
jgi:hypothetical protein